MTRARRERSGDGSIHERFRHGCKERCGKPPSVCPRKISMGWCGQVESGTDHTGRRQRKTVYGTEAKVRREVKELIRQRAIDGELSTSDMLLSKWLVDWLERIAARRLKPNTYRTYKTAINHHITPSIGKIRLGRLGVAHVRRMHADIIDRQELSPTTAHHAHRVLSAALGDAVLEGRVGRNIASVVSAPTKADTERLGFDAATAISLIRQSEDSRWLAALLLGIRQGERNGLRWSHVDLELGVADLSWSLTRVGWAHGCKSGCGTTPRRCPQRRLPIPVGMKFVPLAGNMVLLTPKTRKSRRVVPLPDPLLEALKMRHAAVEVERSAYKVDHDLVWCGPDGSPLDPRKDWGDWQAALEACGIPKQSLHGARHTTATLLLELKVDTKIISAILGHSSVVMTQNYQHASVELSRAALDGLAQRLELTAGAEAG